MSIDERAGRYGAYTSGANALRIGLFDDDDVDDLDYVESRAARYPRPRVARDTTTPARRTTARPRTATPAPRRAPVPRPRRGRTAWASPARTAPAQPAVRLPKAPFVLLLAGLVVAGAIGVLVLNTKINENSFRLGDLRQTQAALSLQEQQLEQQLADLSSPGNLRAAATRLGLVPAGTPVYLNLPDGREVAVPQPASGQQTTDR
jgi:hypothetical protein